LPAHRRDDAWSSPDPVSGAGADIAPASHRAGNGRHAWNRNSGEWRRRERGADWTRPKHASGEWPTLQLDATRDSGEWSKPRADLFGDWRPTETSQVEASQVEETSFADWLDRAGETGRADSPVSPAPPVSPASTAGAILPAAPRWSSEDWAEADRAVNSGLSVRHIDWLDEPDDHALTASLRGLPRGSMWAGLADSPHAGPHDGPEAPNAHDWPDRYDAPTSPAPLRTVEAHHEDNGWTDEEWLEKGSAPTEELFASRAVPRSHRRPEPVRKVTLRVLAAILVAGGSVGLTMNFASGHGPSQAAPVRVDDGVSQDIQRQASSDAATQPPASPAPTDRQTSPVSADSDISAPLAPATTRKPSVVVPAAAPPAAPAAPAPAPTTPPTTAPATPSTTAPTTPPTTAPTTPLTTAPTTPPTSGPTATSPATTSAPASVSATPSSATPASS
jgi:hypothetical protein